jgi:hypothetical protein
MAKASVQFLIAILLSAQWKGRVSVKASASGQRDSRGTASGAGTGLA